MTEPEVDQGEDSRPRVEDASDEWAERNENGIPIVHPSDDED